MGLNPSNQRMRDRFGAREIDLAARERDLAGAEGGFGGRSGREHERGERRIGSRGGEENTFSPSAAGCERAERPRFCPFRPASRGPPVPFSLSVSLLKYVL